MLEEFEEKNRKRMNNMRAVMDYAMGVLVILAGIFFLLRDKLNLELNEVYKPNWVDQVFGGVCILYGGWRIYRGFKKQYD